MKELSDPNWWMVIITSVYVVATIFICIFNAWSSITAKKQLKEMQKQIVDDNRPRIEIEFVLERRKIYVLRLVNHGRHTAYKTKIKLSQDFINSLPNDIFRSLLEQDKNKECLIGVYQHHDLYIGNIQLKRIRNIKPLTGTITYEWNGNKYNEDIYVDIERQMTFFSIDEESQNDINKSKNNDVEIEHIAYELEKIGNILEKVAVQESHSKKNGRWRKIRKRPMKEPTYIRNTGRRNKKVEDN